MCGVASASDSGRMVSTTTLKMSSVLCQPNASINATEIGENRNWPNEPAAVPAPKPSERHDSGSSLPNAPITSVNEQPDSAKPMIKPAVICSISGVVE